ncbi:17193_t:CDS:1 [Dentiscutata erythropus]|uniref:17193_t:CDS:1 n=1 Tax=Dentiscutata erythropus TaxID=1348616 RepID=A0A9N9A070_9GLOM|nr:17193_t:CDS:1 [Dentiscutata erythropus]
MRTKTVDSYNHKSLLTLLRKYLNVALLFIAPLLWLTLVIFSLRGATIDDGGILIPGQPGILLGINTTIRYIIASVISLTVVDVVEASLRHYKSDSIQLNGLELSNLIKLGIERSFLGIIASFRYRPKGLSMIWIWLAIVVIVPYLLAIADIALHYWVTAEVVLQEGQHKILNNAIQIDPKCANTENNSFSELNTCAHWEDVTGSGLRYPNYVSKFKKNLTTNIMGYYMNEGLVIMPRLNDTIWNGNIKSYTIQANCTPVSTLCNLTSDFGAQASIKCPSSLYNVNGNVLNTSNIIIPLGKGASLYNVSIPTSSGQLGKLEWLISGQYVGNPSTKYDKEFVTTLHGPKVIITYCITNIVASTIDFSKSYWSVRLDEPLDANTTRAVSYGIFEMNKELLIALKAASFNGSSMFFAQEAERQLKLGIGGMLASVAVGNIEQGLGEVSVADNITLTRIGIMALILYGIALVIIPVIIAGWILLNSGKYKEEIDSNGHPVVVQTVLAEMITGTDRIVYDAIRAPSCRACFNSIEFQHQLLSQNQAGIGHRDGHFGLFNGIVSSAEGVVNAGTLTSNE